MGNWQTRRAGANNRSAGGSTAWRGGVRNGPHFPADLRPVQHRRPSPRSAPLQPNSPAAAIQLNRLFPPRQQGSSPPARAAAAFCSAFSHTCTPLQVWRPPGPVEGCSRLPWLRLRRSSVFRCPGTRPSVRPSVRSSCPSTNFQCGCCELLGRVTRKLLLRLMHDPRWRGRAQCVHPTASTGNTVQLQECV